MLSECTTIACVTPADYGRLVILVNERNRLRRTLSNILDEADANVCTWTAEESGDSTFETSCGQSFQFFDGGPQENSFNYCHHCGLPVKVAYNYPEDEPQNDVQAAAGGLTQTAAE